jgi:hypothetical protein
MTSRLALFLLLLLPGCSFENPFKSTCEQFYTEMCEQCNVDDYTEDVVCACIEDGEVDNASRYYDNKDEAELSCASARIAWSNNGGSHEYKAECGRELKLLKDYGKDACDYLGYSENESYYDYDTGGW